MSKSHMTQPESVYCSPESCDAHDDDDDFNSTPKHLRGTKKSAGVAVTIPRDILQKMGPASDRLCLSHTQLTGVIASLVNNSGGQVDNLTLST